MNTPAPTNINLPEIQKARETIAPIVRSIPVAHNSAISRYVGVPVYLKLEMFQRTGTFKIRGAYNRMAALSCKERKQGVIAVSAGNHGQAVAYAARNLGTRATIILPKTTPKNH